MHTVFALLCFVVVIHWLIFPYPSGLLHWHWGNLTIAPVPAKQPWWIWINTSCEFIMNDCITTTKQSTTKPCAYFLGYTVVTWHSCTSCNSCNWVYGFRLIHIFWQKINIYDNEQTCSYFTTIRALQYVIHNIDTPGARLTKAYMHFTSYQKFDDLWYLRVMTS